MSSKLKYLFTFSALFFVGFGSYWMISDYKSSDEKQDRVIASLKMNSTIHMEKHLMPLVLTVEGPENYPEDADQSVKLTGSVRTPFSEFTNIHYKWILPDDVDVVIGQVSSDIQNPVQNQIYKFEISVKGFNSLDRKEISLIATTIDPNGAKLGNSTVITSRPQDSLEHLAPVVMLKAQEFKASQEQERMPASEDAK